MPICIPLADDQEARYRVVMDHVWRTGTLGELKAIAAELGWEHRLPFGTYGGGEWMREHGFSTDKGVGVYMPCEEIK